MIGTRQFAHNGLRVLYQHAPGPLTAIALAVRAGARFDGQFPGIAHVSEHMLFQGTATMDQRELNHRAADLGGEHNADTGYETVTLTFEVFNEDLDDALALLAEQVYRTEVAEDRLNKERRVVLDELRGRQDDPTDRLHTRAWNTFFGGALAHPICGTVKSLRSIRADDVRQFLDTHFVHERSVLGIVGGASIDTVRRAVRRRFNAPDKPAAPVPDVSSGRGGRLRCSGGNGQATVLAMMEVPADPAELIAVGLALDLVGSDPDSRLFQEIRERLGLGYDVSAHLDWGPDWAVASVSASASRSAVSRLERAMDETMQRAADGGFGDDEMKRARKKLRYRYASLGESRMDRALSLSEGTMSGFPLPHDAERMVTEMPREAVEAAWRRTVAARRLWAIST
jgi:predicted Zn-dependent peptidase